MSEKKKSKKELIEWAVAMGYFPNVTAARKESHENLLFAFEGHAAKLLEMERVNETPEAKIERLRAKLDAAKGVPFAQRKRRAITKKIRKLISLIGDPVEQKALQDRLATLLSA